MCYKQEVILEFSNKVLRAGYRVFIAKTGTYGFFTDKEGSKVLSFQYDLEGICISGNYKTSNPGQTGSGWSIKRGLTNFMVSNIRNLFASTPPEWALRGATWSYTTLQQHLDMYQKSSQYTEL